MHIKQRVMTNVLIALALVGTLGSVIYFRQSEQRFERQIAMVQEAMERINTEALYHAGLGEVSRTPQGFPKRIDPDWFQRLPLNVLTEHQGPWLETASHEQFPMRDPQEILAEAGRAAFWYNPNMGVLRARVPRQLSRQATVDLYNRVNKTELTVEDVIWPDDLTLAEKEAKRDAPLAAVVGHASRAPRTGTKAGTPAPPDPVLKDFGVKKEE